MPEHSKGIVVLGSSGALGQLALSAAREAQPYLKVVGLGAGINVSLLSQQVQEFRPLFISHVRGEVPPGATSVTGSSFMASEEMVVRPEVHTVVVATVGMVDLPAVAAAIRAGKHVAIANHEILVAAGSVLLSEARAYHSELLPVESEPNAVWQCLRGETTTPANIALTASWGPFIARTLSKAARVTPERALRLPQGPRGRPGPMGKKRVIDAATLMNKGMQVIQCHHLFNLPVASIEVLGHPQALVRCLVAFPDGSVKALMGSQDPRQALHAIFSYPERWHPTAEAPAIDLAAIGSLTFEPLSLERYPCFRLALEAGRRGGTYPAVLNAANEVAVNLFLSRLIGFAEIPRVIESTLSMHRAIADPDLEDILVADGWAREYAAAQAPT